MPRPDPIPPRNVQSVLVNGVFGPGGIEAVMRHLGMLLGAGRRFGSGSSRSGKLGPDKRRRRKGGEPEREPVEPNDPKPRSGGAAAPLEYDDEAGGSA